MASKLSSFGPAVLFRSPIRVSILTNLSAQSSARASSISSFSRLCSSSAVTPPPAPESVKQKHPWTEWIEFVDRLAAEGYFPDKSSFSVEKSGRRLYNDPNLLKEACLVFGRDRYDILNSLSKKDIEVVAKGGCPNLYRKCVNSGKRLRAYVDLEEGDVCGSCHLRGSCDKAYVELKESESDARTVDIVRLLLYYAVDPNLFSGREKPAGREHVESSARKLLSELLHFSETARDPLLAKPVMLSRDAMPKSIELKKGDWLCPKCSFVNFSKNRLCMKCKAGGPNKPSPYEVEGKKGDWSCSKCQFLNFASNRRCLRCNGSERPKLHSNYGQWHCPTCDHLNFRKATVCPKCTFNRPQQPEDNSWKRPPLN